MKKAQITIEICIPDDMFLDPKHIVNIGHDFMHGGALCVTAYGQESLGIAEARVVDVKGEKELNKRGCGGPPLCYDIQCQKEDGHA